MIDLHGTVITIVNSRKAALTGLLIALTRPGFSFGEWESATIDIAH